MIYHEAIFYFFTIKFSVKMQNNVFFNNKMPEQTKSFKDNKNYYIMCKLQQMKQKKIIIKSKLMSI